MTLHDRLSRAWLKNGWWAHLASPLAWLAGRIVQAKRQAYLRGRRQAQRLPVPVIVVGNIFVGGTGKTPFLMSLVEALQARGWQPGVISRGYGVNVGAVPRVGKGQLDPRLFGDEPAMIGRRCQVPVAVHPLRPEAARQLLARYPGVDLLISDDGLQHLALGRDLEIAVQDLRGVGNGRLLPAGPLREPASRLNEVDALITNVGAASPTQAALPFPPPAGVRHTTMHLRITDVTHVSSQQRAPLAAVTGGRQVLAAAAIGHPERFFATLRQAGVELADTLSLPDHFSFERSPFEETKAQIILITDKDAVKCGRLNDDRLWSVSVSAQLADPTFFDWLEQQLHGCPTAHQSRVPPLQGTAAP
ncbi:MAG: tetraacyldisaccharide 4'-kinase [Pigmentiphaga sp.]|nr:tetraacyldisaccharide 4'-kinase [Pigmentiphaga sp.]